MQHPFELQIEDLQSIDFGLVDLNDAEAERLVGGLDLIAGVTVDENEVGGPYVGPAMPVDPGTITADGVGPNEVGGPFTPGPIATTLALGEEGGGGHYFPRHGHRRRPRYRY
jgi:hypothetical protein